MSYHLNRSDEEAYYSDIDSSMFDNVNKTYPAGADAYGHGDANVTDAGINYENNNMEDAELWYEILYVAVLTLGLILLVEEVRQRMDRAASGQPFLVLVLNGVYRELATLGVVELTVHLFQTYGTGGNTDEAVFADVHFLLIYTAIFNAFQAIILAFNANKVSDGLWVKTEELELDHYVELREEFDRLHAELYGENPNQTKKQAKGFSRGYQNFSQPYQNFFRTNSDDENLNGSKLDCLKNFILGAIYTVIYPRQKAKYNRLLIQVRFHELRVHFLESYNLPRKTKVSDYLVKSMMNVLEHFVHVSHSTWLIMAGVCNILYFLKGVNANVSGVADTSRFSISVIFLSTMVGFVLLSILIYFHMETVFKKLMKMNHLWTLNEEVNAKRSEELAAQQNRLFFLGDPQILLTGMKFMHFGYAVAISTMVLYWDYLQADNNFDASAYILTTFICYGVFVAVMARVLPLYCLATSMGQLVDKQLLNKVRSIFHLHEAEQRRHQDHMPAEKRHRSSGFSSQESTHSLSTPHLMGSNGMDSAIIKQSSLFPKLFDVSENSTPNDPPEHRRSMLADLVKMDTKCLRMIVEETSGRYQSMRDTREAVSTMGLVRNSSFSSLGFSVSPTKRSDDLKTCTELSPTPLGPRKVTFGDSAEHVTMFEYSKHRPNGINLDMRTPGANIETMHYCQGPKSGATTELVSEAKNLSKVAVVAETVAKATTTTCLASSEREMSPPLLADIMTDIPHPPITPVAAVTVTSKRVKVLDDDSFVSELSDVAYKQVFDDETETCACRNQQVESLPRISFACRVANFIASPTYKFITDVCGTMVVFFLLGTRVEQFLKHQCIIPEARHSLELSLHVSFRLLIVWMVGFMCMSLVSAALISFEQKRSSLFIAASMDFILCSIGLLLFLVAERQRCCKDASTADMYADEEYFGFRLLQEECIDSTVGCTCLEYGDRLNGGYGNIEPWTALIVFRVFRFHLAKQITTFLQIEEISSNPQDQSHVHGHGHRDAEGKGTAVELWQVALTRFPELVEKHGEFSTEVLQAMLGIEIIESKLEGHGHEICQKHPEKMSKPVVAAGGSKAETENIFQDETYICFKPDAQEIVSTGGFAIPVKRCPNKVAKIDSTVPRRYAAPMAPLEFDFSKEADELERIDSAVSYPNARLVRSMRRCERKLLPLLNKWTPVDVVITSHEMLYVDIADDHDDELYQEDVKRGKATKDALLASNGGKGLRLCDAVAGRRIVGHLTFDDVVTVHVEREQPSHPYSSPGHILGQNEYWQRPDLIDDSGDAASRQLRWEQVNQDRLRILTKHGTLLLRFHSDLHDSEIHPERVLQEAGEESPLHKNIAFQWAQTIVRNCGVNQLQQELPHFGHEDGDELRDYLVILNRRESKHHGRHRRHASIGSLIGGLQVPSPFKRPTQRRHSCKSPRHNPDSVAMDC